MTKEEIIEIVKEHVTWCRLKHRVEIRYYLLTNTIYCRLAVRCVSSRETRL